MDSHSISNIFHKFSILWAFLPYYGKFEEWRKLLSLLSKKTKIEWDNNAVAFQNLSNMTNWDWTQELIALIKFLDLDPNPILNKDFCLKLDFLRKKESSFKFLSEASSMKFKRIKMLQMNWMYKIPEKGIAYTAELFSFSFPSLQILSIEGWNKMNLGKFSSGLYNILPKVHHQVYIDNFKIDEKVLQDVIFPQSYNCKELVLRYWFIDQLSSDFLIEYNHQPKLESLDMFLSWKADLNPE